jgi:hypothetical protein
VTGASAEASRDERGTRPCHISFFDFFFAAHQVNVLQRQVKRPRLNRLDRVFLAAASRAMTRSSWASFVSVAADAPVPAADALVLSLTRHRSVHPRRSGRTCDAA